MARRPDGRKVKRHRSYTVDEAARCLGSSPVTIRRWIKTGLPSMAERKPALILGDDLIAFLKARRPARQKCLPAQCYCLKCHAPRDPAFDEVEIVPISTTSGNMRALCSICATVMHKRVALAGIPALRSRHNMTVTLRYERINENA